MRFASCGMRTGIFSRLMPTKLRLRRIFFALMRTLLATWQNISKLDLPGSELLMTEEGASLPSPMQHLTVVHLFCTTHFVPATHRSSTLLRNFFKASTDFSLMLVVKEISQWLEKNVAQNTGRPNYRKAYHHIAY